LSTLNPSLNPHLQTLSSDVAVLDESAIGVRTRLRHVSLLFVDTNRPSCPFLPSSGPLFGGFPPGSPEVVLPPLQRLLKLILDMDDPERAFVQFSPFDDYVLLVNDMGGTSTLAMCAIADETLLQLSKSPLSLIPLKSR